MVQYDRDGVTLFFIDADGRKHSHNFMEGAAYNDMVNIRDAQIQAIRENTQTIANYETTLANIQISVDAGHAMAAPTKPLMKVVSDTGETTYAPFDPPLRDLRPTAPSSPAPSAPNLQTGAAKDAQRADVMYNMLLALFRKAFPEAQ